MYCRYCGKEIKNENGVCEDCAIKRSSSIPAPESTHSEFKSVQSANRKHFGKKLLPVSAIVLAVVLVAAFAVYAALNFFKTPKQIYMQVEGKNLALAVNNIQKSYSDYYDSEVKPLLEKNYKSKTEVSFNTDLKNIPGIDPQYVSIIEELLKKLTFTSESEVDPVNYQSQSDISLSLQGTSLIQASFFKDKSKMGISIPTLYDKYFVADTSDLKSVYNNLGISGTENFPNRIIGKSDILSAVKLDKEAQKSSLLKYGEFYFDSIDSKSVTIKNNMNIDANGEKIKCREITVNMDESQLENLISGMLDMLKDDDTLYDTVFGNLKSIAELYSEAGYPGYSDMETSLDRNTFKELLNEGRDAVKEVFNNIEMPDGLNMTVMVDGSGQIIERRLELPIRNGEVSGNITLDYQHWKIKKDNTRNTSFECHASNGLNQADIEFASVTTYDAAEKADIGKIIFNIGTDQNGEKFEAAFNAGTSTPTDKTAEPVKNSLDFDLTTKTPDSYNDLKLSGKLEVDRSSNPKEKMKGREYTLTINAVPQSDPGGTVSGTVKINTEEYFDIDFKLPELTDSKTVNLNTISQDELQSVTQELTGAVQEFVFNNSDLFKSFLPAY